MFTRVVRRVIDDGPVLRDMPIGGAQGEVRKTSIDQFDVAYATSNWSITIMAEVATGEGAVRLLSPHAAAILGPLTILRRENPIYIAVSTSEEVEPTEVQAGRLPSVRARTAVAKGSSMRTDFKRPPRMAAVTAGARSAPAATPITWGIFRK